MPCLSFALRGAAAVVAAALLSPVALGQANSPGTLPWNNGTAGSWQHNWGGANTRFAGLSATAGLNNPKNGFDTDVARFQTVVTAGNVPMTAFTNSLSLGAIQSLPLAGVITGGTVTIAGTESAGTVRLNGATTTGSGLTSDIILAATNNDTATGYELTINPGAGLTLQLGTGNGGPLTAVADAGRTITVNAPVTEVAPRALQKTGAGTLVLGGANTYTGTTTVAAGTLLVTNTTGSGTGSGGVAVSAGATLGGTGTVAGPVTFTAATLSPGAAGQAGVLTVQNNVTLNAASAFRADVTATGFDQLRVTGSSARDVDLGGAALALPTPARATGDASRLWLVNNETSGTLTGTFAGLANGAEVPAMAGVGGFGGWTIHYNADFGTNSLTGGNDVALTPVPEPAAVLGVAALGLLWLPRRWRRTGRGA